ncbi:hypothetical protein [Pseudoalteromonas umbrosa]|uniref:hypothetical protein n=1 Tax=Pseudoalteromonas umbrosa TaxID=3048489 RepID=UPI0024C2CBD2|nr:hypothetical protein [Pseudoalteromonas sp. B95]MDK1286809.1 hypothetical protein [Pseudoalteromonas sp. B95]
MKFSFIMFVMVILSGCTAQLWHSPSYQEKVTGFYAASDKKLLLITGTKYSYVFEAGDLLTSSLEVSRHIEFIPTYSGFKIDRNNQLTGTLKLVSNRVADKKMLAVNNIPFDQHGNVALEFNLKGKRYDVEGDFPFQTLADDHYVVIEMPESGVTRVGKIVVTPVAVAIDATTVVPMAAFFGVLGILNKV